MDRLDCSKMGFTHDLTKVMHCNIYNIYNAAVLQRSFAPLRIWRAYFSVIICYYFHFLDGKQDSCIKNLVEQANVWLFASKNLKVHICVVKDFTAFPSCENPGNLLSTAKDPYMAMIETRKSYQAITQENICSKIYLVWQCVMSVKKKESFLSFIGSFPFTKERI